MAKDSGSVKYIFLISILLFVFIASASADERRFSLDSALGNLAEKFKSQMLSPADYSRIVKNKPNQYKIPKDLKIKGLLSIPLLVKQGRVVKTVGVGGQPGYLITFLETSSVYKVLGLKVGDFLAKINGVPLTDDKQIAQVFSNNKTADNIRLDLVRQREKITIFYHFV